MTRRPFLRYWASPRDFAKDVAAGLALAAIAVMLIFAALVVPA